MSSGLPQMLISRHITRLLELWGEDKIPELLKLSCLRRSGDAIERIDGSILTMQDCYNYKLHVRELFGDRTYEFARVNFILGGCRCHDCKPHADGRLRTPRHARSGALEDRDGKGRKDF